MLSEAIAAAAQPEMQAWWVKWLSLVVGGAAALLGAGAAPPPLGQVAAEVVEYVLPPSWPDSYYITDGETFDYIVVGAGAAGSAAATRLALAGHRVLLVEAGGDPNIITRIPGAAMGLLASDMDWAYKTQPNYVSCLSSTDNQCRFSRGKCLGGSTSINYMLYVRGNRDDFLDWGVPGWTWADVEPYFLRYEGLRDLDQLPVSSRPYHNTTGIMDIELFGDSGNDWHERLFEGFEELGFPRNGDCNGVSQVGVTQSVGYVYQGERMSTARAYLLRNDFGARLRVAKHTHCTGVLIDEGKVARGISAITGALIKRKVKVYARKEVILSAGTVGTPQILMLSGIGPAAHLQEMGIPVVADLPVGDDMSDHVLALLLAKVDRGFGADVPSLFVFGAKGVQALEWALTRTGPLASNGLTDVMAIYNSDCYDFEARKLVANGSACEYPTSQVINAYIDRNLVPSAKPIVKNSLGFVDSVFDQINEANINHALIVMSPVVLRPKSRGRVRLASADPAVAPAVFPEYLAEEADLTELLRSIRLVEQLLQTGPFAARNASLLRVRLPDCPEYDSAAPEPYWRCYCRHLTYSVYHAVGTAALGPVLTPRLQVKGVAALRVADLSAAPLLPRGNTEALAVAIGERVAHFLAEDASARAVPDVHKTFATPIAALKRFLIGIRH